jgi:CheY-like chemotaxis protein
LFGGGRSVTKILVADDNSNIQKMVGLALKDQGIDVVAVGNGEAAVRKIADVRPDLVLADVFMPVRNGYEVCKFVKGDSSLAHIPVILLVGAFDPLDEQEAQRVGADGVLKKPFVPPDPLISMVKSALLRASSGHTAASSGTEKTTASMIGSSPHPTVAHNRAPTAVALPDQVDHAQSFVEDIPARPEEVKIDSSNQPVAFGSLLTPSVPEPEEEAAYVAPVNPELADRDWSGPDEVTEEEEEDSGSGGWQRDGGNEAFANEVETTAEKTTSRAKRRESWSPTREKAQDLLEAAVEPDLISAPPLEIKASAPAPAAAEPKDSWAKPEKQELGTKGRVPENAPLPAQAQPSASQSDVMPMPAPSSPELGSAEVPTPQPATPNNASSWFSTTASPWEAEAQKASQLASTWDAPAAAVNSEGTAPVERVKQESPIADSALPMDFVSEVPSEEPVYYERDPALVSNQPVSNETLPELISGGEMPAGAIDAIRQETSYAVESLVQQAKKAPADSSAKDVSSAPPDMDALVAKVLAKMSPEMLQAVTREILKPVVEAMVRDEIGSKKS